MIYTHIAPSADLRHIVSNFLLAHFIFDPSHPIPVKAFSPKPELCMTFLPEGYLSLEEPVTGVRYLSPRISICGQQIRRFNFHLPNKYLMIRVNFQPGALYRFIRTPLKYFTDLWLNAENVLGPDVAHMNEKILNCSSYSQMIHVVENYLRQESSKMKMYERPVDKVAAFILNNSSKVSLDWLAREAFLSHRQFHRTFNDIMGVSPKLFSRIVRFYKAYMYKERHMHEDWLSIAVQFGYADYQHMVKDFKEFSLVSPPNWINQDTRSPEKLLNLA